MVEIKKLEKLTWGAKHQISGEILQKFDECKDVWTPGISASTGAYITGLDKETRREFEQDLFLKEGELSSNNEDYWSNFSVLIPRDGLKLYPELEVLDKLKVHVIKACPETADSKSEGLSIKKKVYYVHDQNNEAKISNSKREYKIKAYVTLDKMTRDEVVDTLYMMGMDPGEISDEVARDILGKEVDADARLFCEIAGDQFFKDKVWIVKLIRKGILSKSNVGAGYDLPIRFGDILLGNNLVESVSFLKKAENSNILEGIKEAEALKD
tara:strand:+ start:383 stop:1189 length:807 start_codon:yes stop_codon:yes gene_type:complete